MTTRARAVDATHRTQDDHGNAQHELPLQVATVIGAPSLTPAGVGRLLVLVAQVRAAVRATTLPAYEELLRTAYVICANFDEHNEQFAFCVVGPSGSAAWLTRELLEGLRVRHRFPFRLWGRTPAQITACELTDADDCAPLPELDLSVFHSADYRLGSTVLTNVLPAYPGRPIVLFARDAIPGWPV